MLSRCISRFVVKITWMTFMLRKARTVVTILIIENFEKVREPYKKLKKRPLRFFFRVMRWLPAIYLTDDMYATQWTE